MWEEKCLLPANFAFSRMLLNGLFMRFSKHCILMGELDLLGVVNGTSGRFFFSVFWQAIVFKYKLHRYSNRHQSGAMVKGVDSDAWEPEIETRTNPKKKKSAKNGGKRERHLDRETKSWIENGAERHLDRWWWDSGKLPFYYSVY